MHAIQRFHYDRLQGCLKKIRKESEDFMLPEDHLQSVFLQEERLKKLLQNYQEALQHLALILKDYEKEQQLTQSLIYVHKKYRKEVLKSNKVSRLLIKTQ